MYRHRTMEAERPQEEFEVGQQPNVEFVGRVASLPVVQSAYSQLLSLYGRTKESNRLARFTLNTAETGLNLALYTAKPILAKLPVATLDHVACSQLDKLEHSYPIITKQTDQVLSESCALYEATLKPTVDTVVAVGTHSMSVAHSYSVKPVVDAKERTRQKLTELAELGGSRLEQGKQKGLVVMDTMVQSQYGQQVNQLMGHALDITESIMDKHLPAVETEGTGDSPAEVDEVEIRGNLQRTMDLSFRVLHYAQALALNNLKTVQGRSMDLVAKLNIVTEMLEKVRDLADGTKQGVSTKLELLRERLLHMWSEFQKTEADFEVEKPSENESSAAALERMVIATARHLSANMSNLYSTLTTSLAHLPDTLRTKVSEATHISQTLTYLFTSTKVEGQELPALAVSTIRTQLNQLHTLMGSIANFSLDLMAESPLGDLVVPDLDGITFGEMEWDRSPQPGINYVPCQPETEAY